MEMLLGFLVLLACLLVGVRHGGIGLAVCVLVALLASCVLREGGKDLTGLTLKTLKKDK